jgi:hypothetical protein
MIQSVISALSFPFQRFQKGFEHEHDNEHDLGKDRKEPLMKESISQDWGERALEHPEARARFWETMH